MEYKTIKNTIEKQLQGNKTCLGIEYNLNSTIKINGFKPFANIIIIDEILNEVLFYLNKDFSGGIKFEEITNIRFGDDEIWTMKIGKKNTKKK